MVLFVGLVGLGEACTHVRVLGLQLFDISEELADIFRLEGQVFVVSKNLLFSHGHVGRRLLLLFVLLVNSVFLLDSFVNEGNDGLDFISEEKLFLLVTHKLNSNDLAKLSHEGSLVAD